MLPFREIENQARACFKNGYVKGHDFSRAENDAKIEGF
jgi:hypothetical protein